MHQQLSHSATLLKTIRLKPLVRVIPHPPRVQLVMYVPHSPRSEPPGKGMVFTSKDPLMPNIMCQ
jgi:hypothetical protein